MDTSVITRLHKTFEEFVHYDDDIEFWQARELQKLLGYEDWKNFGKIIEKAQIACESSKQKITDHFHEITKIIDLGKGGKREVVDLQLSRYACYLIAQNGDPRKEEIAFAMTYFAVQTRKQEVLEKRISEWERLQAREKLTLSEKEFSALAFERGVDGQGFGRIRSKGDAALFGGKNTKQMKSKLKVSAKRALSDFLPTVTIKAKDLATEITNFNIRKDEQLSNETKITTEHVKNNRNIRAVLGKSGIKPEELPAAEDAQILQRKLKSEKKKLAQGAKRLKN